MDTTRLLRIEPIDYLFFRGGRPFGPASRAESGLPMPQTVAGALRTAMLNLSGIDLERLGRLIKSGKSFSDAASALGDMGNAVGRVRLRGPWLGKNGACVYPAPATLRHVEQQDRIIRLDPLHAGLPGWTPRAKGMKPLWSKHRTRLARVTGYLTEGGMARYLGGSVPLHEDVVSSKELYDFEDRTGIGIDSKRRTAADGLIYSVRLLVLRPDVCIYVRVVGPERALSLFAPEGTLFPLGGEGRRAVVYPQDAADTGSELEVRPTKGRHSIVLTTPALVNGWCPPNLNPVSAAVSGYEAVSGWDLARGGPKPNRFAVPAGSVYFMDSQSTDGFHSADSELGWGSYVTGTWNYV